MTFADKLDALLIQEYVDGNYGQMSLVEMKANVLRQALADLREKHPEGFDDD